MLTLRQPFHPLLPFVALLVVLACDSPLVAQLIPGTGRRLIEAGDDFEDEKWSYTFHFPKSSREQDQQTRLPAGIANNRRLFEPVLRGQPDVIERVSTPVGGLPGSQGALRIVTRESGIPGQPDHKTHQDDLIVNFAGVGLVAPSRSPSVVVRVHLPPFEEWEPRTGNSFGFRATCKGTKSSSSRSRSRSRSSLEDYWPGMFFHFYSSKTDSRYNEDFAMLIVRANDRGADVFGPRITQAGWWTLGMSFTPDGRVHYYAHPGVENLTERDRIGSFHCYGFRCQRLDSFFFDVLNHYDGKTWSTSWVIDDPMLYVAER